MLIAVSKKVVLPIFFSNKQTYLTITSRNLGFLESALNSAFDGI